jgi:hypothetical protein
MRERATRCAKGPGIHPGASMTLGSGRHHAIGRATDGPSTHVHGPEGPACGAKPDPRRPGRAGESPRRRPRPNPGQIAPGPAEATRHRAAAAADREGADDAATALSFTAASTRVHHRDSRDHAPSISLLPHGHHLSTGIRHLGSTRRGWRGVQRVSPMLRRAGQHEGSGDTGGLVESGPPSMGPARPVRGRHGAGAPVASGWAAGAALSVTAIGRSAPARRRSRRNGHSCIA